MNRINKLKNATGGFMHLRWLGLALILCAVTGAAHAKQEQELEFRFARILSDGMVLQQEKPSKIWGWAKPDTQVSVTLMQDTATRIAAVEGAGEVWVCAGQSSMGWGNSNRKDPRRRFVGLPWHALRGVARLVGQAARRCPQQDPLAGVFAGDCERFLSGPLSLWDVPAPLPQSTRRHP